jgi:pantothenate kinase
MSKSTSVEGLVEVGTALAVLRRVNLLAESNALAIDIGGSLAKLLYLQPYGSAKTSPRLVIDRVGGSSARGLSVHVPSLKGTLHFFAFETRNIEQLVAFMREQCWVGGGACESDEHRYVRATGGGAFKYADLFLEEIGVTLTRLDEMSCVVAGLNFLLTTVDREVYVFKNAAENPNARTSSVPPSMENARDFVRKSDDPFPYLLVNIGSGVSIVKVIGHGQFERVSGSSLGGGTFWGLARLLLNCQTFDDVIDLTRGADNANVDMLVADIYGGSYATLGLDANVIAASFGKVTMRKDSPNVMSIRAMWRRWLRAVRGTLTLWLSFWLVVPIVGSILRYIGAEHRTSRSLANLSLAWHFRPQDVALSLLRMVSYNIGQIAYLNAKLHGLERIYFGGNFIRDHPYTIADISFAVQFWSGGKSQALFMRHDGYLGAIGAFIGGCSSPSAAPDIPKRHRTTVADPDSVPGVEPLRDSSSIPCVHSGRAESSSDSCDVSGVEVPLFNESIGTKRSVEQEPTDTAKNLLQPSSLGNVALPVDGNSTPPNDHDVLSNDCDEDDEHGGCAAPKHSDFPDGKEKGNRKKKKKRKKRKQGAASDFNNGGGALPGNDYSNHGSGLVFGIESGTSNLEDGAGRAVYFDDVYHESYRLASQGEWQTVVRHRHRSSATSQSDSEER